MSTRLRQYKSDFAKQVNNAIHCVIPTINPIQSLPQQKKKPILQMILRRTEYVKRREKRLRAERETMLDLITARNTMISDALSQHATNLIGER